MSDDDDDDDDDNGDDDDDDDRDDENVGSDKQVNLYVDLSSKRKDSTL